VEESIHVVCDETNSIVQENSLEDEDAGFRIRIMHLKMKPKLKSLNKAKKSLPHLLKTSQENGELKETSPWTTLLAKYQREYLLALDSRFYAITWLLFLRIEPRNIDEALYDEHWLLAVHEELNQFKRIIKYLKGTTNVGLWYPKGTSLNLIGFSDSDFARCKLDRKCTSETCHLLGSSLVS